MKDLPISKRLLVTFGIILFTFCCTVILSIFSLFSIGGNFDNFYNGPFEITNKAADLRANIQTVAKYIGYSMMEEDEGVTAEYIQGAKDNIQLLREGTAFMRENIDSDMLSIIDDYDSIMKGIMNDRDMVLELAGQNKNDEAVELYFSSVMPAFKEANDLLLKLDNQVVADAARTFESSASQKNIITAILLALSVITFGVTLFLASYIIRSITKPIKEIENAAKEMSEGSLQVSISYESRDEIGSLANSMRTLTSGISAIVEDIGRILGALGEGNFRIKSQCLDKYKKDYKPILEHMRVIRDNLNETMLQINEASKQVAAGSGQMAQSAQGLAEGATEQAGAIEELTATIENVANMAENSSASAQKAYEVVKVSAEKAENSKNEMEALTRAMERISETSKQIENIIGSIEDIASQTNLLSLNASIEAARAGEAGRGFAVVADQIGKLATDSAQSAVSTKELISTTLREIEEGNTITQKASAAFDKVIDDMKTFAGVAKDTSEDSLTQFENLQQVKSGIEQISTVVQSNSAAAEETSATSEELSAQAENLEMQVTRFQLLE